MPIYEYECDTCHNVFERLVFVEDDKDIECPKCHETKTRKLLSPVSFMNSAGVGSCTSNSSGGFS